jgi:hypothetical protein
LKTEAFKWNGGAKEIDKDENLAVFEICEVFFEVNY